MKLFVGIIMLLFSAMSFALPDQFFVYSSQISGTKDTVCRSILHLYAQKYNSNPIFIIKKGAGGTIAMMSMLEDQKFSVLCSGPSESIYNVKAFPGKEREHAMLIPAIILATGPSSFYTKPDGKFKTIDELRNHSESIIVGFNAEGPRSAAKAILGDREIIWVPFTNSVDSLASLLNGSLDMYADSGSLEELAKAGKLKSFRFVGGNGSMSGQDLSTKFPIAAQLPAFVALTLSANTQVEDINEFNSRIRSLINTPEYVTAIGKIGWAPAGLTVTESNVLINKFRATVEKLSNGK